MKKLFTFFVLCLAALSLNAADYYVAGTIPGISWDNRGEMVKDGNVYTYTWTATADGTYEFKITACATGWDCANYGNETGNNIVFSCKTGDVVVITFDPAIPSITVSGNTETPVTDIKYYVAGTLPGCEWNPASQEMTQDSENKNLWKYTFTAEAASYEFKITQGTWAIQYNEGNIDENSPIALSANGENVKVTFAAAGQAAIIFNADTKKISASQQGQGETPITETKFYVAGDMNNWSHEAMTQDPEHTNLWHYSFTAEIENVTFKVCSQPNWNGTNYGENNSTDGAAGNFPTNCKAGDSVTITFDADAKQITVAINSDPTALNNTNLQTVATKLVRNGAVYILRNGILYTTTGQIAK